MADGDTAVAEHQDADADERSGALGFSWAAFAMAIVAIFAAALAIAIAISTGDDDAGGSAASGPTQKAAIELGDLFIKSDVTTFEADSPVEFRVTNGGDIAHDFWLPGGEHTAMLAPGESETLTAVLNDGDVAYCAVPGHQDGGMALELEVTGGTGGASGAPSDAEESPAIVLDFNAAADDAFEARDPAAPVADSVRQHDIRLEATDETIEVAPGVTQAAWTFGGSVPGPVLRGRVGDIFNVTLVNKGAIDHSVDFHASKVAWNDEMRSIKPGEELQYRFEAKHSGIFMYHCGTAPALHHIGNGMFGAVIIEPEDLEPVDHEFVFVQSELYLGEEGKEADLGKMKTDAWDAVVFNGYVNQYRDRPIRVEPNDRVRAWVLDAGPSENSAFHVVGTIFDTVFKEGAYTLRPTSAAGGSQALDLQPSQGGFVEFSFDEAGLYPIVTHKFSNVARGALGLFQAGEVDAGGGAAH